MAPAPPKRKELNDILLGLLGTGNVYFQPPQDAVMQYPCIVYERDNASVKHADDIPYRITQRYQVTLIAQDPDSDMVDQLLALPLCSFSRHFATSGLNHDVFVIYH